MSNTIDFVFVAKDAPMSEMGVDLADLLVQSNFATTKSDARRKIESGAVRLNNQQVIDPFARVLLDGKKFIIVQRDAQPIDSVEEN